MTTAASPNKIDLVGGNEIKLLIFDLDGVLVDSRPLHYHSLNRALAEVDEKYVITLEEHLARYDGRSTSTKLKMLTKEKGLPTNLYDRIWKRKQDITSILINELGPDERIAGVLKALKERGYTIYVGSNSIWNTIKLFLLRKGFMEYVDFILSTEDLKVGKPNPHVYMSGINRAGISPRETLILEDSDIGRKAAHLSCAHVFEVIDPTHITLENILAQIEKAEVSNRMEDTKIQGQLENLQVIIPCAGLGSRFAKEGYKNPKPLIPTLDGKPMIDLVIENLNVKAKFIFVIQKKHCEEFGFDQHLKKVCPGCEVVIIDGLTEGSASTCLAARHLINNEHPLLMANSDQFTVWNSSRYLYQSMSENVSGSILCFQDNDPKWSYVKLGPNGFVSEVREKEVISDIATVGIYFWRKGSDYVKYADQMIAKNIRYSNEFYNAPIYNEMIADGKNIKVISIAKTDMWGIGIPKDLEYFLKNYKGPSHN